MIDFKVIDGFLDDDNFQELKNTMIMSKYFPWFYNKSVACEHEETPDFYFIHLFYANFNANSKYYGLMVPIIDKLKPKAIIRIKGNLYTRTEEKIKHNSHIDYEYSHQGAILYLNENNGPTVLHDGTEIYPKENRMLLFDASKPHFSTTCTDQKIRVNINFNFLN